MRRLAVLATMLLMAVGCAPSGIHVEGAEALPYETAEDWATYADHLVQIHIESEHRIAPSDEEVEAGEGVIGREVAATVRKTLWTRPGTPSASPKSMRWSAGGWAFQGKDEKPLLYDGTATMVVGHDYLVPITYTSLVGPDLSPPEWYPLGGMSVMPIR